VAFQALALFQIGGFEVSGRDRHLAVAVQLDAERTFLGGGGRPGRPTTFTPLNRLSGFGFLRRFPRRDGRTQLPHFKLAGPGALE